jgi:transaldolase
MKFFIDTADVEAIRELAKSGLVDGVTTNPSLVAKSGHSSFLGLIKEICDVVDGPVSAEVAATDYETMVAEGRKLAQIADNVVVKLPLTPDGLKACRTFTDEGIKTNVTLCFSVGQAILAAKAGATFVSPFVGRLDDISSDGMQLIADICEVYNNYPQWETEVLVASARGPQHVVDSARLGADVVTIPPQVLGQLFNHPLTAKGLETFVADWKKTGQSIL